MKILTAIAILQLYLLVKDATATCLDSGKVVICYYLTPIADLNGTLDIKDIDPSICTHLVVDKTAKRQLVEEYLEMNYTMSKPTSDGMLRQFQKLKERNPELKVILHMPFRDLTMIRKIWNSTEETNITEGSIRLLTEMGFDGFDFSIRYSPQEELDKMADTFCEMKTEFEKNGFIITTTLTEMLDTGKFPGGEQNYNYTKIAECSQHFKILSLNQESDVTHRVSSLRIMKSRLEYYMKRGFPPQKIVIAVPTMGTIFALLDPQDTEPGGRIDFNRTPETGDDISPGVIFHRDLMKEMQNSSLEWTVRRDEETREPYAFTKSGLWASYDDRDSMELKVNYVLERGLAGIATFLINLEDSEGIGGEERFPMTRIAYKTIRGRCQSVDTNP